MRHWTTGYPVDPPESVRGYVPVVFPVTVMVPVPLLTVPAALTYPWILGILLYVAAAFDMVRYVDAAFVWVSYVDAAFVWDRYVDAALAVVR